MQFGRGTALDKMAVHLNAWAQGQNKEGILGGMLRLCQSRQGTKARPGGSTETGRGQPSIVQAQSTPTSDRSPVPGLWALTLPLEKEEGKRTGAMCCWAKTKCSECTVAVTVVISDTFAGHCPGCHRGLAQPVGSRCASTACFSRYWISWGSDFFSPRKEAKITDSSDTLFGFCLLI